MALVAQGLAHVDPGGGAQGNLTNPVVKLIFDCLSEQKKELNAAACTALGLVGLVNGEHRSVWWVGEARQRRRTERGGLHVFSFD